MLIHELENIYVSFPDRKKNMDDRQGKTQPPDGGLSGSLSQSKFKIGAGYKFDSDGVCPLSAVQANAIRETIEQRKWRRISAACAIFCGPGEKNETGFSSLFRFKFFYGVYNQIVMRIGTPSAEEVFRCIGCHRFFLEYLKRKYPVADRYMQGCAFFSFYAEAGAKTFSRRLK